VQAFTHQACEFQIGGLDLQIKVQFLCPTALSKPKKARRVAVQADRTSSCITAFTIIFLIMIARIYATQARIFSLRMTAS